MNTTNHTVAAEIYVQLGGGRFSMMTGSKSVLAGRTLNVHLPRGFAQAGIKIVAVTLEADDTYTLQAYTRDGTAVGRERGIYCDGLQDAFTRLTGLYTSLGVCAS